MASSLYGALEAFRKGKEASETLERLDSYIKRAKLIFTTADITDDKKKKSLIQIWGGDDLMKLFEHTGGVNDKDTFDDAIRKIKGGLKATINEVFPMYKLFHQLPQGNKKFSDWYPGVLEHAQRCPLEDYTVERAARDAIAMQTSSARLRKKALTDGPDFKTLVKLGCTLESADKQAAAMMQTEPVRNVKKEKHKSSKQVLCYTCGYEKERSHRKGYCPAKEKKCAACNKIGHFAKSQACKGSKHIRSVDNSNNSDSSTGASDSESDDEIGRITVGSLHTGKADEELVTVKINGEETTKRVDSGCRKTLIGISEYRSLKCKAPLRRTNVKFTPYGTKQTLPIKGRARVTLTATGGACHETWIYVVNDEVEALLGAEDAKKLGILQINSEGTTNMVHSVAASKISGPTTDIQKILDKYEHMFHGVGSFNGEEIEFKIDESVTPVVQRNRPIALAYRERVEEHIKELIDNDIIEGPLDSTEPLEWVSNVVITGKKWGDGSNIRLNVDMRDANKAIKRTHYPIPTVQELRHAFHGATRYTKLDMNHAFHQMPLSKESRHLTNFRTHQGIYRFKRLVMGASPASEEFHEKLRRAICDLDGHVQIKDDIIVYGRTQDEHDQHLQQMLQRLSDRGFTLRKNKCEWNQAEVLYFGYIFNEKGMSADPAKIKAIKETSSPKSIAEVKSFIQMCQYNAYFIGQAGGKPFSDMTAPLRRLLCKGEKFKWTRECEAAVQKLKTALVSERVMGAFSPNRETQLVVDRGPEGIAATVMQRESTSDEWQPINYTSRAKTKTEKNYSPIEGESLAIYSGILTNKMYLYGIPFTVITDHKPLPPLYNSYKKTGPVRVERHRVRLQGFDFSVKYEPGRYNPCDYNSRHPLPLPNYEEDEKEEFGVEEGTELYINAIIAEDLPDAVTLKILQYETNQDDTLAMLKADILKGDLSNRPEVRPFRGVFNELSIVRSLVLRGTRIVIPEALQSDVIALAHEGHQGLTKTKQYLRTRVWFPKMDQMTQEYIDTCLPCQAATDRNHTEPLKPTAMPERPWQKLAMDFKGPIASKFYFFLLIDEYSRFPEVEIVTSTSAESVIPKLHRILCTHGIPEEIKSDNGPPFNGEEIKNYAKRQGFRHRLIEPEHPESNGLAENFMRMLTKVAHTAYTAKQDPRRAVNNYLLNYRATPHSTTGETPAEILFGRKIITKVPIMAPRCQTKIHQSVKQRDQTSKRKAKQLYDKRKHSREHRLKVGDKVLLKQRKSTTQTPYDPQPFTVIAHKGSMVTARRKHQTFTRDASKWKAMPDRPDNLKARERPKGEREKDRAQDSDDDLDNLMTKPRDQVQTTVEDEAANASNEQRQDIPDNPPGMRRYPSRERHPPRYFNDYEL